jgi:uncharacterized protein (DUF2062 family)
VTNPDEAQTPASPPASGVWRRRFVAPIVQQLTHGVTPDKVAATLSVGTVCSLFPFLGFTTMLNLGVGLWLRMNQPLMQALNYALTPVHLVMIVVYVRIGERIWGATDARFSVTELVTTFKEASFAEFIARFGWAGVHAFTAWVVTAPLIIACLYFPLRPALRAASRRLTAGKTPPTPAAAEARPADRSPPGDS